MNNFWNTYVIRNGMNCIETVKIAISKNRSRAHNKTRTNNGIKQSPGILNELNSSITLINIVNNIKIDRFHESR